MILQELNVKIGLLLDGLKKDTKKVKEETKGMEDMFKTLKGALISIGVFAFLKDAISNFMEAERASLILGMRMKALGGDFAAAQKRVEAFADAMSRASGINDEELKRSLVSLTDVTKDAEVSMSLLQDAMDLHVATGIDMKRASELVGRAYAGERGELAELGKMFGVAQDEATSFEVVMKVVRAQIEGTATNTDDLTKKMGEIASVFGDLKEQVGRLAAGGGFWSGILVSLIDMTTKSLKVVNEFQDALRASWANLGSIFKKGFKSTQDEARQIFSDFVSNTVEIFKKGEDTKTKIAKTQKGKRQKWADDMAKKAKTDLQKAKMDLIKAEDAAMRIRITKGQSTNEQMLALMTTHAEQIKTLYGEMSVEYQGYEQSRIDATLAANDTIMALGQAAVASLSTGFEALFMSVAEGGASTAEAVEAFARSMGRSFLSSIASAMEAEAAKGMVGYLSNMLIAGPWGAAGVSAYSLPLIATMMASAGMVRGLSNMMAEGGTLTSAQLVMMAETPSGEPETAIPLSRMDEVFQKYSHFIGKRQGTGAGGKTVVNVARINDNRGAIVASSSYDKGRAARNLGQMLVERGIISKKK